MTKIELEQKLIEFANRQIPEAMSIRGSVYKALEDCNIQLKIAIENIIDKFDNECVVNSFKPIKHYTLLVGYNKQSIEAIWTVEIDDKYYNIKVLYVNK